MEDSRIFLNHINDNYDNLKKRFRNFCIEKHYDFDEDIFGDTIIKCHDAIEKKGSLRDTTPQGIENYLFQSFKTNLKREKQYSRNSRRDTNVTGVEELYEEYYNDVNITSQQKVKNDLFKDFATLYIMMLVEQNFPPEHFHLFQLKSLCNLTYRQLAEKTHSKGVRQKVLDVKNWLKEHVTKAEIKKAYDQQYRQLM